MMFGSRQMRSKLDIPRLPFMGRYLVPEDTARDLGVYLDANSTFDEHITKTVSKCTSCLSQAEPSMHLINVRSWSSFTL